MKLYISDISVFALIIFYVPLVIWLWRKIIKMPITILKKIVLSVLFFIVAYLIPLGDVTYNSIAMAKACPTAGLKIYKTVEVDGYLGTASKESFSRSPYSFIEGAIPGKRVKRYKKNADNTISFEVIAAPTAMYEVVSVPWHLDTFYKVKTHGYEFRNRVTKEKLAESKMFKPLLGWVDHWLVYRWFGSGGGESCGDASAVENVQKIFIPK